MRVVGSVTLFLSVLASALPAASAAAPAPQPSVLILPGRGYSPLCKPDYNWLNKLHKAGFALDVKYSEKLPDWDALRRYNALLMLGLPPFSDSVAGLLDRYLDAGGGLFLIPNLTGYAGTLKCMKSWNAYLARWGARVPLEHIHDLTTVTTHPRSTRKFVYTDKILASPVSEGVKALWFPGGEKDNWAWHAFGHAIEVTPEWTVVARGSDSSFTKPMSEVGASAEHDLLPEMFFRPEPGVPPDLFAIRQAGNGRVALTVSDPIFHVFGGTSWIHDGVMLSKGLQRRPSHFGRLVENTCRWLAEPSVKNGRLGGHVQDPLQLKHPNSRKSPNEYFGEFDSYQNPTPPSAVFRGLIGARSAYSSGQGTVAEYAAAAREAGLDFVVFTEEFAELTEEKYRKLERECKDLSSEDLVLIPGMALMSNIGNHLWGHGFGIPWLKPSQLAGPDRRRIRLQCFDKDGKLAHSDEDAKNWLWAFHGVTGRNIGYCDFTGNPGVPVRNLRLFGILAVITYRNGAMIEDLTRDYLDYVSDGCPPLACAMDVVHSPAQLKKAVADGHYLTHVGAKAIAEVGAALQYGHQYGRPNVYLSAGPKIRSWAGTQRFSTYAGESFVTARRRARPELWVTSDVGLKEIVIYSETRLHRRFLFNGDKEFRVTFEWAYDRHRELTAIVTDVKGNRAISASRSLWSDTNYNGWCNDRQNGELWHGPGAAPGPRRPKFSVGPTWDGGPPPPAFGNLEIHPAVRTTERRQEGWFRLHGGRLMEGNQFATCYDDTVANAACLTTHNYAPGVVANAYHTLGPITPSKLFTALLRRTQFLQRPVGVNLDWHAMYAERAGGTVAVYEGTTTLKQDLEIEAVHCASILPHSYPKDGGNVPLLAFNAGDGSTGVGRAETFDWPAVRGLGAGKGGWFQLPPGGYVAMLPSKLGLPTVLFNIGAEPMRARATRAFGAWWLSHRRTGPCKKGSDFRYRFMVVYDPIDEGAVNTLRIENLRRYFGLHGENGCGLRVSKGKLISQFGLIELEAEQGLVAFEAPRPGWRVNLPLGVRLHGFNPNWTVGQYQVTGYSQRFYTDGKKVYRQLGLDDRGFAHLGIYPDHAPNTHNVVGHPLQCDAKELIIQVTKLSDRKPAWHVAVNNPTDRPIATTLRKTMDMPGFDFVETPVNVPAGGYVVVRQN